MINEKVEKSLYPELECFIKKYNEYRKAGGTFNLKRESIVNYLKKTSPEFQDLMIQRYIWVMIRNKDSIKDTPNYIAQKKIFNNILKRLQEERLTYKTGFEKIDEESIEAMLLLDTLLIESSIKELILAAKKIKDKLGQIIKDDELKECLKRTKFKDFEALDIINYQYELLYDIDKKIDFNNALGVNKILKKYFQEGLAIYNLQKYKTSEDLLRSKDFVIIKESIKVLNKVNEKEYLKDFMIDLSNQDDDKFKDFKHAIFNAMKDEINYVIPVLGVSLSELIKDNASTINDYLDARLHTLIKKTAKEDFIKEGASEIIVSPKDLWNKLITDMCFKPVSAPNEISDMLKTVRGDVTYAQKIKNNYELLSFPDFHSFVINALVEKIGERLNTKIVRQGDLIKIDLSSFSNELSLKAKGVIKKMLNYDESLYNFMIDIAYFYKRQDLGGFVLKSNIKDETEESVHKQILTDCFEAKLEKDDLNEKIESLMMKREINKATVKQKTKKF